MMLGLLQLYKMILKFALLLAVLGGLKNATLVMMGKTARAQQAILK